MPTLSEMASMQAEIYSVFDTEGEDLSDIEIDIFRYKLESIAKEAGDKLDAYVQVIRAKEARAKAMREAAKNYREMAEKEEKECDRLTGALLSYMQQTNTLKVETKLHTITLAKAGGYRVVTIDDEASVPDTFKIPKYHIDKVAIRNAIESGLEVTGARLEERKDVIKIK